MASTRLRVAAVVLLGATAAASAAVAYDRFWGSGARRRAAQAAFDADDLAAAAALLDAQLRSHPGDLDAHLLAARTARRSLVPVLPGLVEEGWDAGTPPAGTAARFREHLDAYTRLGGPPEIVRLEEILFRVQCGEPDADRKDLETLVSQDVPESDLILEALALGYLQTYRLYEARDFLSRWIARRETARARLWRGWTTARVNGGSDMLDDLFRAVELAPGDDTARLALANQLIICSRYPEAADQFAELERRRPGNAAVAVGRAKCLAGLNRPTEARAGLDALLSRSPRPVSGLVERGRLGMQEGRLAEAEADLRAAVAANPSSRDAVYQLSLCLARQGKDGEAAEVRKTLDRVQTDVTRLGEVTRQIAALHQQPAPALRVEAGTILVRNGHAREGARWFTSALQDDPGYRPAHRALAEYYEKTGDRQLAASHRGAAGR